MSEDKGYDFDRHGNPTDALRSRQDKYLFQFPEKESGQRLTPGERGTFFRDEFAYRFKALMYLGILLLVMGIAGLVVGGNDLELQVFETIGVIAVYLGAAVATLGALPRVVGGLVAGGGVLVVGLKIWLPGSFTWGEGLFLGGCILLGCALLRREKPNLR